ncbi:hypothetical protein AVEN_674-1 [Araneus ventricosus]|uniref:Uncharacterized protein n=1 Tax=Araneus ventricosus TaxID=182803 RepID=A0A4Y2BW74_ARAVE|nr:hypothetical protein AVEN_674-1 [Araneus ventricosus]
MDFKLRRSEKSWKAPQQEQQFITDQRCDRVMIIGTLQHLQEHAADMQLRIGQLQLLHEHYFMISVTAHRALLIKILENCHMPDGSQLPIDCFDFT